MDRIVILANGTWSTRTQIRRHAAAADFVIAADGGFAKARRARVRVDLVVGDFDSLAPGAFRALERAGIEVRRHPVEKDASDLELALDEALARRPRSVTIVGALGARIDHTLTNIHLLERGAAAGVDVRLVHGADTIALIEGPSVLADARVGDRVSLVPLSETARVSTEGLRYPLRDEVLRRCASRGVSNEVAALPVRIDAAAGRLIAIHGRREVRR